MFHGMADIWLFGKFERFLLEPLPGTVITTNPNRMPFAVSAVDMGEYWHGYKQAEFGTPAWRHYRWKKSRFRQVEAVQA
jgi:hypothetical protein